MHEACHFLSAHQKFKVEIPYDRSMTMKHPSKNPKSIHAKGEQTEAYSEYGK
jgi:hypothetical protein